MTLRILIPIVIVLVFVALLLSPLFWLFKDIPDDRIEHDEFKDRE